MKFFIPTATPEHAERVWRQMRQFADPALCGRLSDRRVFRVEIERDGKALVAEVGQAMANDANELVFAILESEGDYFICTLNHGITQGRPFRIDSKTVRTAVDFDPEVDIPMLGARV